MMKHVHIWQVYVAKKPLAKIAEPKYYNTVKYVNETHPRPRGPSKQF